MESDCDVQSNRSLLYSAPDTAPEQPLRAAPRGVYCSNLASNMTKSRTTIAKLESVVAGEATGSAPDGVSVKPGSK